MAEKKTKTVVAASESSPAPERKMKEAKPVGNASGLRTGAVILWVVAIVFEVLALMVVLGKLNLHIGSSMVQLILCLVLDLACVIIGSQLWKKANRIAPVSESNKAKFWLWNNMGVIVCCFAFIPFIIILLTNKNIDGKTKKVALIAAIVALLIGGVASYDFNPVSLEDLTTAETVLSGETVYWSPYGKVYHLDMDCQALNQSDTLTYGSVDEAVAANRTRLCKFCANRHDITEVKTDD